MKGLTNRGSANARVPVIGKVKVGIVSDGRPKSLDYFVATGNYAQYFTEAFGDKPSSIEVMFLSNDFAQSCWERFELRVGPKLYAYGDGEEFKVYEPSADEYVDMNMKQHGETIKGLHKKLKAEWTTVLHLTFLIPRIRGVFGAWQFSTRGEKSSIPGIISSFKMVQDVAGTVIGIPFDLQVVSVVSQKPESKSRYPVIRLVANVSQGHLEKVRDFLSSRNQFIGLLTEQKIDDLAMEEAAKQIEHKEE